MAKIEVELKSLLGSEEQASNLREKMLLVDPHTKLVSTSLQRTHYFQGGDINALAQSVLHRCLSEEKCIQFEDIAKEAKNFSVRTRQTNDDVLLIVKIGLQNEDNDNGNSRIEFEEKVNIPLDALDALILGSGFLYQAKWSRARQEYLCRGLNVSLNKNAGYGWVAEIEKMIDMEDQIESARSEIRALMRELGIEELSTDRLQRMFSFYNAHWPQYYGTDKVFTVA